MRVHEKRLRNGPPSSSFVPTAYVINRASRPDRYRAFETNFESWRAYAHIQRVDAVDSESNPNLREYHPIMTHGQIGCYLSHLRCLARFLETEDAWCYVFEDDATCGTKYERVATEFGASSYDLLILGCRNVHAKTRPVYHPELDTFVFDQPDHLWGAHAYAINRKGARALLNHAFPIRLPYDLYYTRPKNIRIGACLKVCNPVNQIDSDTRIRLVDILRFLLVWGLVPVAFLWILFRSIRTR